MNGKKAKAIRKEAESITVNLPLVAYRNITHHNGQTQRVLTKSTRYTYQAIKKVCKRRPELTPALHIT